MAKRIKGLSGYDKQVLLQSISVNLRGFFEELEKETFDLCVSEFFDKYYKELSRLNFYMKKDYPKIDFSTNNIDTLYRRHHMRD